MANLSTLTIQLDGDSARLIKELKKAQKRTTQFGKKMRSSLNSSVKGFALMGGAAAIAGAAIVRAQLSSIDALAKTADKLGITTKNLAGLQLAAKITGVEQATLNKALVRQQKAISDANKGLTTYADQFKKLNLNTQELAKLNPAEQFKVIADALQGVENQTEKTSIMYDIFGGRAVDLINTMKLGTEGLNAFEAEAVALGLAVSRIDAAKVEAANDAIARAKSATEGLAKSFTVALAPYIEAAALEIIELTKDTKNFGSAAGVIKSIGESFANVADVVRGLKVVFLGLKTIVFAVGTAIFIFFEDIRSVITVKLMAIVSTLELLSEAGAHLGYKVFAGTADTMAKVKKQLEVDQISIEETGNRLVESTKAAFSEMNSLALEVMPSAAFAEMWAKLEADASAAQSRIEEQVRVTSSGVNSEAIIAPMSEEDFAASIQEKANAQIQADIAIFDSKIGLQTALTEHELNQRVLTNEKLIELAIMQAATEAEIKQASMEQLSESGILSPAQEVEMQEWKQKRINEIVSEGAKERLKIESDAGKNLLKFDLRSQKGRVASLTALATVTEKFGKGGVKLAAKLQKAKQLISMKDAIVNTATGVTEALKLPFPASLAAAASVGIAGALQIATIAGQGGGGGGGGGGFSSLSTPSYAGNTADAIDEEVEQNKAPTSVQIIIEGDVNGVDEYLESKMIPALEAAVNERDFVFIRQGSRQAEEILA